MKKRNNPADKITIDFNDFDWVRTIIISLLNNYGPMDLQEINAILFNNYGKKLTVASFYNGISWLGGADKSVALVLKNSENKWYTTKNLTNDVILDNFETSKLIFMVDEIARFNKRKDNLHNIFIEITDFPDNATAVEQINDVFNSLKSLTSRFKAKISIK